MSVLLSHVSVETRPYKKYEMMNIKTLVEHLACREDTSSVSSHLTTDGGSRHPVALPWHLQVRQGWGILGAG